MSDLKNHIAEARAFTKRHLPQCAEEMLEWQDTALLRDGRMRELGKLCSKIDPQYSLKLAEGMVTRAALEYVKDAAAKGE